MKGDERKYREMVRNVDNVIKVFFLNTFPFFGVILAELIKKKMDGFTHLAEIYGFKCYFNCETMEVKGINWFNEKMIDVFVWLEQNFPFNDSFEIKIIKELD